MTSKTFFYVDDDEVGLRSLRPAAVFAASSRDTQSSSQPARENFAGYGWSSIHIIKEPEYLFSEAMNLFVVLNRLSEFMTPMKFQKKGDGWPSDIYTEASGTESNSDLFNYAFVKDNFFIVTKGIGSQIKEIYYRSPLSQAGQLLLLRHAIGVINQIEEVVVTDYFEEMCGLASDKAFMDAYFVSMLREEQP